MISHIEWIRKGKRVLVAIKGDNPYDCLCALSEYYLTTKQTASDRRQYVRNIAWMFTDDGGMDWSEDKHSIKELSHLLAIASGWDERGRQ